MPARLFARNVTPVEIEEAHEEGNRHWGRRRANPYEVEGEQVSPLLWWAWNMGARLGAYLDAEKRGVFDKKMAERTEKAAMLPTRWPFARGAV